MRTLAFALMSGSTPASVDASDGDSSGIAVHTATRIESAASPGVILVSQTVRDLTAGSGLVDEDAGHQELKGLIGPWRLFSVCA